MMKTLLLFLIGFLLLDFSLLAQQNFKTDIFKTKKGELEITFIGHGSLMFKFDGKIIQIDPFSSKADYSKLPKADLVLITHDHGDHFDTKAIGLTIKENTLLLMPKKCKEMLADFKNVLVVKNDEKLNEIGIDIEAIPAYNILNKRESGEFYHPKGQGNGYILTIAGKRILIGGDTENTPEIKALKKIDIAFLPMNLPYTMTPEMLADAAKSFKPKILYPYHYGKTDTNELIGLLKEEKSIELRIRKM